MAIRLSASRLDLGNARLDNADLRGYSELQNALGNVSGATSIDLSLGTVVTATVTAATTFSVTNIPSTTQYVSFTLILTNGGRFAVTWMSGTKWQNSIAPTLSAVSTDVLTFFTTDNGTTWRGSVAMLNASAGSQAFAWGTGPYTGVSAAINRSSPTQIAGTWATVTSGRNHSVALQPDGSLWVWGYANNGVLGIPSININSAVSSPIQVPGTWIMGVAGDNNSFALRADRSIWVWGANYSGSLGLGDTIKRSSPVQLAGTWASVSSDNQKTLIINSSGDMFAMGLAGTFGAIGVGDLNNRSSPVQIAGTWSQVAVGVHHAVALKTNGTLWAIGGYNTLGSLGLSDTINRSSPVQIGALNSWTSVAASMTGFVSGATRSDNSLFMWGFPSTNGTLGLNDSVTRSSPTQLSGNWSAISIGAYSSFGRRTDNTLWSWGLNSEGRLGLNDTMNRSSPVQIGSNVWSSNTSGKNVAFGIRP